MIYITHRMSEVYEICDRITLLRDGKLVFTDLIENVDNHRLLAGIVGSEDVNQFPEKYRETGDVIFEAKHVTCKGKYEDVSFYPAGWRNPGICGSGGSREDRDCQNDSSAVTTWIPGNSSTAGKSCGCGIRWML